MECRPRKNEGDPGNQFPVEAYDNFTKQVVPRWTNTDSAIIAAYTALVDKICPCVLLFHTSGGAKPERPRSTASEL